MSCLKTRHRAVLAMRCYEQMSYDEVAESLGCSNIAARMLFYRAKKSLGKELARHGLGKGGVLMALILFGKLTATTEAAVAGISVSAASLKIGIPATVISILLSKSLLVTLLSI